MNSNKDHDTDKMQAPRRDRGAMSHEEAESAVPEDMAVMGEEDGGVGIQHWWNEDEPEEDDGGDAP